ncbi:hypothetical protein [Scytonema sp. PRP1]
MLSSFAGNMRTALPNAAFIGFTGTPLLMRFRAFLTDNKF